MRSLSLSLWLVLVLSLHVSCSFSSSVPPRSSHLCIRNHRDALLRFKNSISSDDCSFDFGSYFRRTETWNKSIDCCSWQGVECDDLTGHAIGVNLTHSCLSGSLSASSTLFHLRNLQWLDLSSNNLTGSILENCWKRDGPKV